MTRDEHLAWCKQRANEYLDEGNVVAAVASMLSDLSKHDGTRIPKGSILLSYGVLVAQKNDPREAKRFIDGFN